MDDEVTSHAFTMRPPTPRRTPDADAPGRPGTGDAGPSPPGGRTPVHALRTAGEPVPVPRTRPARHRAILAG
ncbi:hypothetical protein PYK79_14915 [Streptomyces sp. ID05-04B]|nr:hypothetical protein C6376_02990 [Streptomyces sp. P3]MDX5564340.1 hypothetical protein [Streptomyces sp. ID05-04B]